MIKKRKSQKQNPVEESGFYTNIKNAIIDAGPQYLSAALAYKSCGLNCKDCNKRYYMCQCEGGVDGGPCKICKQNYCICHLEFNTDDDLRKYAWNLAKEKLTEENLEALIIRLCEEIERFPSFLKASKFLTNWYAKNKKA